MTTIFASGPAALAASSLQISPVNLEVPAPGAASKITLENPGGEALNAQIRIYKWVQINGQDELVPTRDVVASPPALKLAPGKKGVVRVVRVNKSPATSEETYRLVVDEVPKPIKPGQSGVSFALRYSIPVFFSQAGLESDVAWSASFSGGKLILQAQNAGQRRVKVSALKVVNSSGKIIIVAEGLAGYVLGQSSKTWAVGGKAKSISGTIKIIAKSDIGPIEVTTNVVAAN